MCIQEIVRLNERACQKLFQNYHLLAREQRHFAHVYRHFAQINCNRPPFERQRDGMGESLSCKAAVYCNARAFVGLR